MVARNQQRHQVFTFAIIKNAFFLLVSKLAFTETSSVLLKMYKLLKIIRRQLIFKQTSLLRLLLIVVSHTVKIRKFKMLYFQNERRYRAENFYKDLFFSPLQHGIHKNSEGLAILTTSQWKHSIGDTFLWLFSQASKLLLPVEKHDIGGVYDPFSPKPFPKGRMGKYEVK